MHTPQQLEMLEKEDWRFHAIGMVRSGLGMIATSEKVGSRVVSFGLPSGPALCLAAARSAHLQRVAIDVEGAFIHHPPPQGTWPEDHRALFDFFQLFMTEVVLSFTSIEAFVNESIPPDFTYSFKSAKETKVLNRPEIERLVSLDEKLKKVLPLAHNVKSPAGTKHWRGFKELKTVRDRLIHMKSMDRESSGPEHQTIWGLMIEKRAHDFPAIALGLIASFEALVKERRWFQRACQSIPPTGQPSVAPNVAR